MKTYVLIITIILNLLVANSILGQPEEASNQQKNTIFTQMSLLGQAQTTVAADLLVKVTQGFSLGWSAGILDFGAGNLPADGYEHSLFFSGQGQAKTGISPSSRVGLGYNFQRKSIYLDSRLGLASDIGPSLGYEIGGAVRQYFQKEDNFNFSFYLAIKAAIW